MEEDDRNAHADRLHVDPVAVTNIKKRARDIASPDMTLPTRYLLASWIDVNKPLRCMHHKWQM